jgi:hypothetical protein
MSYRSLLKHRCNVIGLVTTADDGSPVTVWQQKATDIRCFLDLSFIRKGKDPYWSESAGRPTDRTGVLFLMGDAQIKAGDRIIMTRGPSGSFSIEGAIDETWTPSARHHLEVGVKEVATQLARGALYQDNANG